MKYCIGIIIDNNNNFNKVVNLLDTINAKIQIVNYTDDAGNVGTRYVLAGTNIDCSVHFVINAHIPTAIRNKIQGDNGLAILNSEFLWFTEKDYTYDYLKQRLLQWMGEEGCEKAWVIDQDTNVITTSTDDLLSRFIRFY